MGAVAVATRSATVSCSLEIRGLMVAVRELGIGPRAREAGPYRAANPPDGAQV